jgi:hypothetical protein
VHIAEEETKFGFSEEEVLHVLSHNTWQKFTHLKIEGLMGMATFTPDERQLRKEFRGLKKFFDQLKSSALPPAVRMTTLSMGMSSDYTIALEEGSTMIRIGTAIFGERNKTGL